jgi:lipopolysaccharide biosynthesis protein
LEGLEFPSTKKIALVAHLFYIDSLETFFDALDDFPRDATIFVSVNSESSKGIVEGEANLHARQVHVRVAKNRGRNFLPLFVIFGPELCKFDYIFHVHTKKSLHSKKIGKAWNDRLWNFVVGDVSIVKRTLNLMENDKNLVVAYPWVCDLVPSGNFKWGANRKHATALLKRMGSRTRLVASEQFAFPAGGMFVMTGRYFSDLQKMKLKSSDFPEELGQIDGTAQHAIERIIGFYSEKRGLKQLVYHEQFDVFTSDTAYLERERDSWVKIFS